MWQYIPKLIEKLTRLKCRHFHKGIRWSGGTFYYCARPTCNLKWDIPSDIISGHHKYKLKQTQDQVQTQGEQ